MLNICLSGPFLFTYKRELLLHILLSRQNYATRSGWSCCETADLSIRLSLSWLSDANALWVLFEVVSGDTKCLGPFVLLHPLRTIDQEQTCRTPWGNDPGVSRRPTRRAIGCVGVRPPNCSAVSTFPITPKHAFITFLVLLATGVLNLLFCTGVTTTHYFLYRLGSGIKRSGGKH
jgi:hypothetical protein